MSGTAQSRATLLSVATAVPDVLVTSDDVKEYFPKAFELDARRLAVMYAVMDNAQVRQRHSLEQISCEYKTHAIKLGRQAAEDELAAAHLEPQDIDLIITVSCTGV